MWWASMRSWVFKMRKYLQRGFWNEWEVRFSIFFHRRPVSSGSESSINVCILMAFGPDIECWTTCVAGSVVELCETETVDIPAAAALCGTETVGVRIPATFCGLETAGASSSWSDMILVAKYNVHANRLVQCFGNNTFNHLQPWWSKQQHVLWKTT